MNLFNEDPATPGNKREELLAKWKDKAPEEVLNAKVESDLYIETILARQDETNKMILEQKKQLDAQASLQELVDRLNQQATPNSAPPKADGGNESPEPIDYKKEFSSFYEEARRAEKQAANAKEVQTKLRERFGNTYQDVLRDTGLSEARINEIAAESPAAIFRLVGLDDNKRETFQAPPRSAEASRFAPKGQTKRDWNYYQELKKTNPKLYLDPKIAVQMHNDAIALGDDFGIPG